MFNAAFKRVACALAFAACFVLAASAEPDTKAKAQVFTRELSRGTRVIFSWDDREPVSFTSESGGNKVILHFDEPVALRWGSSIKAASPTIKQVESRDGGETVILTLSKPADAQYFQSDGPRDLDPNKNGIDLVKAPDSRPEQLADSDNDETPAAEDSVPARPAHKQRAHVKTRKVAKAKAAPKPEQEEASDLAKLAPAAGMPAPALPLAEPHAAAPTTLPPPAPATPATPAATAPVVTLPVAIAAPVTTVTSPASPPAPASVSIPLPFKDDDAFAAFVWHKHLWIVSNSAATLSPDELRKAGAPLVQDAKILPDPHATILFMPLAGTASASIEKTATGRALVLGGAPAKLTQQLAPALNTQNGKASLVIPAAGSGAVVHFRSPVTGDTLSVIPTTASGAGVAAPRSFVEFSLLPTAQGIAVQSISDAVSVSLEKGEVRIAAAEGLALSQQVTEQMEDSESEALLAHIPPTLFPYARWKLEDEKQFIPTQVKLFNEIASGAPDYANKARLKLLHLYLAEGLYTEAVGMADDILRSSLKFYLANNVSALRGAAYLMMYHIADAQRDFSMPELKKDREAQMWLGLADELLGQEGPPFDFAANYDRYISHYPPVFIGKLGIIAADLEIDRKQYEAADNIFDTLKRDNYDEPVKKYIDYMRAKILSENHEEAEAAKIWEDQAKDLDDPLIRARAEFSLINMLLKSDKITHEDAEKRLDQLRIVWRGDSLEVNVLTLLAGLYVQDKQYDKALHTMRDIVLYYPQVPEAMATAQEMEKIFVMLYNQGGADKMQPLQALSLFYEFRDLVPLGAEGDEMIRNLADRLVKIDLLDRAALLLDHQIRNRLQGEERSKIGAHLAKIYLMNHQPDEALDILKTTGYGNLPADQQLSRLRLTAQALAQQGQTARAIDVISTDNSPEGTLLRLSIYWDNKDWSHVTSIAEDILGNRNDPGAPLTPQESDVLLKLATSYVYQHDLGQLQYLRDYFTPLMKNNPSRDSFLFITAESGNIDYDNLASLDQDIGAVKSYLAKTQAQDTPGKNGMSKAAN